MPPVGEWRGVKKNGSKYQARISQNGQQVMLGSFETQRQAALAHDLFTVCLSDEDPKTNFNAEVYAQERAHRSEMSIEELQLELKRFTKKGASFSSKFRGVCASREDGFRVRIRLGPDCPRYILGTFSDEEEAARAYDRAAVEKSGLSAKTNFPLSDYLDYFGSKEERQQARALSCKNLSVKQAVLETPDDSRPGWMHHFDALEKHPERYQRIHPTPNTSKFRGVCWSTQTKKWKSVVVVPGSKKTVSLGQFDDEEAAARAYDEYAVKVHVKRSKLNFPLEARDSPGSESDESDANPEGGEAPEEEPLKKIRCVCKGKKRCRSADHDWGSEESDVGTESTEAPEEETTQQTSPACERRSPGQDNAAPALEVVRLEQLLAGGPGPAQDVSAKARKDASPHRGTTPAAEAGNVGEPYAVPASLLFQREETADAQNASQCATSRQTGDPEVGRITFIGIEDEDLELASNGKRVHRYYLLDQHNHRHLAAEGNCCGNSELKQFTYSAHPQFTEMLPMRSGSTLEDVQKWLSCILSSFNPPASNQVQPHPSSQEHPPDTRSSCVLRSRGSKGALKENTHCSR